MWLQAIWLLCARSPHDFAPILLPVRVIPIPVSLSILNSPEASAPTARAAGQAHARACLTPPRPPSACSAASGCSKRHAARRHRPARWHRRPPAIMPMPGAGYPPGAIIPGRAAHHRAARESGSGGIGPPGKPPIGDIIGPPGGTGPTGGAHRAGRRRRRPGRAPPAACAARAARCAPGPAPAGPHAGRGHSRRGRSLDAGAGRPIPSGPGHRREGAGGGGERGGAAPREAGGDRFAVRHTARGDRATRRIHCCRVATPTMDLDFLALRPRRRRRRPALRPPPSDDILAAAAPLPLGPCARGRRG